MNLLYLNQNTESFIFGIDLKLIQLISVRFGREL